MVFFKKSLAYNLNLNENCTTSIFAKRDKFFESFFKPVFVNFKGIGSVFFEGREQNAKINPFKSKQRRSNQEQKN